MKLTTRGCLVNLFFASLPFLIVACLLGLIAWNCWTSRVVAEWNQPANVHHLRGPFVLRVVEMPDWNWLALRKHTQLFVALAVEADDWYGYYFDIEFSPGREDYDTHVGRSVVTWTDDGIDFQTPTGDQLFIPASKFNSGR
jgi:hypothetical protein